MPVDTVFEMFMGFAVVLGGVLFYGLTLIIRTRHALEKRNKELET
jgi:hypothetical protein